MQSARCWNTRFTHFLKTYKLRAVEADPCVFISQDTEHRIILAIYMGLYGLIAAKHCDIVQLLDELQREFEINVFDARVFLGTRNTSNE